MTAQKYFRKTLEEEGVKIVDVETFGSKDSEYSAQLTNIENAKTGRGYCVQLLSGGSTDFKKDA